MEGRSGFPLPPWNVNSIALHRETQFLMGGRFREKLPYSHFVGCRFDVGDLGAGIVGTGAAGPRGSCSHWSPPTATYYGSKISATTAEFCGFFGRRSNPTGA